jgi:hypothetical protein
MMAKLTEEQMEQIKKDVDKRIVDKMYGYKEEFNEFLINRSELKSDDTHQFTAFELFTIEKLAIMAISQEQGMIKMMNSVKSTLNQFGDKIVQSVRGEK